MPDDYFDDVAEEDQPWPTEVGLDDDLDQQEYAEDGTERACVCGHEATPEGFEAHVRHIYRDEGGAERDAPREE